MKKIIGIFAVALLLASCSKDEADPQAPTIPLNEITLQAPTPDNVNLVEPEMTECVYEDGVYKTSYQNGQVLYVTYIKSSTKNGIVERCVLYDLGGTSEAVVLPNTIKIPNAVNGPVPLDTIALYRGKNNYAEGVKSLTLGANLKLSNKTFTNNIKNLKDLQTIYIAAGQTSFVSINGAVYSADMKSLIMCPPARAGEFSIANGTEVVKKGAFDPDSKLIRIVFPETVNKIESEACLYNSSLQVINMLGGEPPVADKYAFGHFARKATLCVPSGYIGNYTNPIEESEGFKEFTKVVEVVY